MVNKVKVIKINILGQDYFIKSSANQNYFKEISKYVNEKMQEIIDSGIDPVTQQLKIAVLACMNITAELFDIKIKSKDVISKVESQALKISEYIDKKIDSIQ